MGNIEDGYISFKGIPYAEPPTGQNRWKHSFPKHSWSPRTLNATKIGAICPQNKDWGILQSEDCLFLNVWTPNVNGSFPVIIYLIGGGFLEGHNSRTYMNGDYVAKYGKTVMVAMNYRIGALGFAPMNGLLNFGLTDQRTAFNWVIDNIHHFGGDKSKITLVGHSAGSSSGAIHLVSKETKPFFQKLILTGHPAGLNYRSQQESNLIEDLFTLKIGCRRGDMDCCRSKNISTILKAQEEVVVLPIPPNLNQTRKILTWQPIIDGKDIVEQPLESIRKGDFKKIPVLLGSIKDEGAVFIMDMIKDPMPTYQYRSLLYLFLGKESVRFTEYYKPHPSDARGAFIDAFGDYFFICANRAYANALSKQVNTYLFHFDYSPVRDPSNIRPICNNQQRSCHGAELVYYFYTFEKYPEFKPSREEIELGRLMLKNWVDFNPSGWENLAKYDEKDISISFDLTTRFLPNHKKRLCDYLDHFGYV